MQRRAIERAAGAGTALAEDEWQRDQDRQQSGQRAAHDGPQDAAHRQALTALRAPGKTELRDMDSGLLAQLMAQGRDEGAELVTLRAIAEEAGELGAGRALARLGLDDPAAAKDMAELRELLAAWRDAKRSAWRAALGWIAHLAGALLLAGLAVRLGFGDWIR
jgi:hypothetical protein